MKLLVISSVLTALTGCATGPDTGHAALVQQALSRLPEGTRQLANGALLAPSGRQYFVIPPAGRLVGRPAWPFVDDHGLPPVDQRRNGTRISAYPF